MAAERLLESRCRDADRVEVGERGDARRLLDRALELGGGHLGVLDPLGVLGQADLDQARPELAEVAASRGLLRELAEGGDRDRVAQAPALGHGLACVVDGEPAPLVAVHVGAEVHARARGGLRRDHAHELLALVREAKRGLAGPLDLCRERHGANDSLGRVMAFALSVEVPAHVDRPALVAPAPREISFGHVAGTVGRGTDTVTVLVNGKPAAKARVQGRRFTVQVKLPTTDAQVRVVAEDALGNGAATAVGPVFGLPRRGLDASGRAHVDRELARRIEELVEGFSGISAVYVQDLRTGAGAAWNATARFPAASTVKLAIAVEVLRRLEERPSRDSDLDRLLELMLVHSDNEAANELLEWIGGSGEGGAGLVNSTLAALGLGDSHLYGGFLTGSGGGEPIPLTTESQPSFEGKYTTAHDLAELHRFVHLAAAGGGPLVEGVSGSFTPEDARFLLWILAHSADRGKLDRYVGDAAIVPHKAGWVSDARHDAGLVYWRGGAFVVAVMTYTGGGAGEASDELAGRVAEAALERFRAGDESGDAPAA